MPSPNVIAVVHLAGFSTGIVLYGMLMVMTARAGNDRLVTDGSAGLRIMPIGVSLLGLIWNAIALVLYALRDFHLGHPSPWLGAVAFTALGFLPAVVVHSATREGLPGRLGGGLTVAAFMLSVTGGVFQLLAAFRGAIPSRPGLITLTIGFGTILLLLPFVVRRHEHNWQRSLVVVALAAFAVSALHLSQPEEQSASWLMELVGHHASLPLVLVILYQDYRFAFADLFLRRALSLLALVALAVALTVFVADRGAAVTEAQSVATTLRYIGLCVVTALAYPWLRDMVGSFVDRVVLDRGNYGQLRETLSARLQQAVAVDEALSHATAFAETALGARRVAVFEESADDAPAAPVRSSPHSRESAQVRIPTVDAPHHVMDISDLAGGRRLLSDDHALLDWMATTTARRIDAIRVARERYDRGLREQEILRLATEAELRALRAQLNPHFLFNALTTIGFLLQTAPDRALHTLYRLTSLLRAVLRRSEGTFVTLAEELEMVSSYLAIEHARFEERLTVHLDVPTALHTVRLPPLLLQPLVENAIKHGIAPLARGGHVTVRAELHQGAGPSNAPSVLHLIVADTGAGLSTTAWQRSGGVGLSNIEARLRLYYGSAAELRLSATPEGGTQAEIRLPVPSASDVAVRFKAAS